MTGPVESEKHVWQRKHWKLVLKNRYYLKNCNIGVLLLHSVRSVVEVILILYSEIKCVYQGWLLKAEWDSSSCWQLYLGSFITGNNSSLSFCCCSQPRLNKHLYSQRNCFLDFITRLFLLCPVCVDDNTCAANMFPSLKSKFYYGTTVYTIVDFRFHFSISHPM